MATVIKLEKSTVKSVQEHCYISSINSILWLLSLPYMWLGSS